MSITSQALSESFKDRENSLHRVRHDLQGKCTHVKAFSAEIQCYLAELKRLVAESNSNLPAELAGSLTRLIDEDLFPCSTYLQISADSLQGQISDLFSSDNNHAVEGEEANFAAAGINRGSDGSVPVDSQNSHQLSSQNSGNLSLVAKEPLRVFMLDDEPAYVYLISRYLKSNSQYAITVDSCHDPIEAMERCPNQDYDLLLVDHNLPNLSGTQFLAQLNTQMKGATPPAIMLTSDSDQAVVCDALRANAADFLSKDVVTRGSLSRSIHNVISKHKLQCSVVQRTAELQSANKDLTTKNREIHDFYQNVSHEVKTPLAAAREFISILHDGLMGPMSTDQNEILDLAMVSCDQITRHFNDLVEMTRLDAGKVVLRPKLVTLDAVLKRSLASCTEIMKAKDIQVIQHVEVTANKLTVDADRLTQVLSNLLGNAGKYAPPASTINLTVRTVEKDNLEFCVADSGQGIAVDELENIFRRLYQSTDIHDESTGAGIGLGLSIAREIVRLHGGEIWADSQVGKGSQFYFRIPIQTVVEDVASDKE